MQCDTQTKVEIECESEFSVTPYSTFLLSSLDGELFAGKKICDFGCGTGVIGLNILASYDCEVIGLDIISRAIELSKKNALRNKIDRCSYITVDEFENTPVYEKNLVSFDYIISNPASIPTPCSAEYHPSTYGGEEGSQMILDLFKFADLYLKKDGQVLFLHTSLAPVEKTLQYLNENRYEVFVEGVKQLEFRPHYRSCEKHFEFLRNNGQIFFFENYGKRYELVYFIRAKKTH